MIEVTQMAIYCSRQLLSRLVCTVTLNAPASTMSTHPFEGIKVVELAGLAPVPFCGLVLADFGAQVTVIKKGGDELLEQRMTRGKTQKIVDLKSENGLREVREMCGASDVLLDPYRPGVLEKMGLNPVDLIKDNKKLIVARITGYGQTGEMAPRAGHDINYVSLTGMLPTIAGHSPHRLPYWPPANLLADFGGGGLSAAFGVAAALFQRERNGGFGGVVDVSMVEGLAYLSSFITAYKDIDLMWNKPYAWFSGDSPIYRTYLTADNKYMAVGALEPKFTKTLFETLNLKSTVNDLLERPEEVTKEMESVFRSKTRTEWTRIFKYIDACVTPVLEMEEVDNFKHHQQRECFIHEGNKFWGGPAPKIYTAEQFAIFLKKDKAVSGWQPFSSI
uniref:Alpha-methylacyl-CoA racemase n=1 Tax=Parascaris univalens TaxID=6257 RepID=A0A915AWF9_PARUN